MSAYIIATIEVSDAEDYQTYASQTVAQAEAWGGRFLVKGGAPEQVEGESPSRFVVIEFPDRETAKKWYNSPEYQEILPIALRTSRRNIVIVDGV
nr:DUF1330 domain-containing protein [uncultured Celeribacter sp.]